MNKSQNRSHWVSWGFSAFVVMLVLINAGLTFSFGFTYLGRSFGRGELANYAGAIYAILIFDIAYVAWFYTFLRTAQSTGQRSLALGLTIFSLLGSISCTLQQLATNATALVDLSAYHQTVGYIALVAMLVMTAGHIVASAGYVLLDPSERTKQMLAGVKGALLEDSLAKAEKMIQLDTEDLIAFMSADVRADVLHSLGFTNDLRPLKHTVLPSANRQPERDDAETVLVMDTEERTPVRESFVPYSVNGASNGGGIDPFGSG